MDLLISDKIWEKIKPNNKTFDAGLLCGPCIIKKIEKLFGYSIFELIES